MFVLYYDQIMVSRFDKLRELYGSTSVISLANEIEGAIHSKNENL